MKAEEQKGLGLSDRFAAALISVLALAATLAFAYGFLFVLGAKARWAGMSFVNAIVFSPFSVAVLGLGAVAGFLLGMPRLTQVLGALWGTTDEHDSPVIVRVTRAVVYGLVALLLLALGVSLLLR